VKETEGKMKRGKIYDWEDFGFDHLTYDEVHNANHIVGKVKIEDRRFASDFRSQNQQTSKLGLILGWLHNIFKIKMMEKCYFTFCNSFYQ
jgi:hypothetical protein